MATKFIGSVAVIRKGNRRCSFTAGRVADVQRFTASYLIPTITTFCCLTSEAVGAQNLMPASTIIRHGIWSRTLSVYAKWLGQRNGWCLAVHGAPRWRWLIRKLTQITLAKSYCAVFLPSESRK